jgi:hypothetical protein
VEALGTPTTCETFCASLAVVNSPAVAGGSWNAGPPGAYHPPNPTAVTLVSSDGGYWSVIASGPGPAELLNEVELGAVVTASPIAV